MTQRMPKHGRVQIKNKLKISEVISENVTEMDVVLRDKHHTA